MHIHLPRLLPLLSLLFFFNDTATTEIYTLSLHDALPISAIARCPNYLRAAPLAFSNALRFRLDVLVQPEQVVRDRKSTRLNSSHTVISYAVFCLKKKKNKKALYNYT